MMSIPHISVPKHALMNAILTLIALLWNLIAVVALAQLYLVHVKMNHVSQLL